MVDTEMQDVPRDMEAIGEVVIRGDNVMDGYYKEPEGTAAVMSGAWLHTGDMAVWDDENYIHIVDRKKDIIISGGENISSIEVEKAIFAHPAVFECAVVAAPDEQVGRDSGGVCGSQAGPEAFAGGVVHISPGAHREIQNAARGGVRGGRAAQDRDGKDREARTAREILGGQRAAGAGMRAAGAAVFALCLGVCGAQAQIDPVLARVIQETKAIDNHAHPLRYDARRTAARRGLRCAAVRHPRAGARPGRDPAPTIRN